MAIGAFAWADVAATNLGLAAFPPGMQDGPLSAFVVREDSQGMDLNGDGKIDNTSLHVFDARTGRTRNLGVTAGGFLLRGRLLSIDVPEAVQGRDLNGDGDLDDLVRHVFDADRRSLTNLRLAVAFRGTRIDGPLLTLDVSESAQGQDLNGDGDTQDVVPHVFDARFGSVFNTRLAARSGVDLDGRWVAFSVGESEQGGADLNGDGDTDDEVAFAVDTLTRRRINLGLAIAPFFLDLGGDVLILGVDERAQNVDLNGDGFLGDVVLHQRSLRDRRAATVNLGLVPVDQPMCDPAQDFAIFRVQETPRTGDLNGDGDRNDQIVHVLNTATGAVENLRQDARFVALLEGRAAALGVAESLTGDLNGDGDIADLVLHLVTREPRRIVNTQLAIGEREFRLLWQTRQPGPLFGFGVDEFEQGRRDLNGDGDGQDVVFHVSDLRSGETVNSGLEARIRADAVLAESLPPTGSLFPLPVFEAAQGGADLNGDGDTDDLVLHIFDAAARTSVNVGLAVPRIVSQFSADMPAIANGKGFMAFGVREQDTDLNGDGDLNDFVLHVVDLARARPTNLRRAVLFGPGTGMSTSDFGIASGGPGLGDAFTFFVDEASQGADLNGNGLTRDTVVHAARLTDRNRNGVFDFAEER